MGKDHSSSSPQFIGNAKLNYVKLAVILFVFWCLISGMYTTPRGLLTGIGAALVIAKICLPMLNVQNYDGTHSYSILSAFNPRLIPYAIWLFKELVMANIDVALAVWPKKMKVDPIVIRFTIHYDNPAAITMLSNSITLTPGTTNFFIRDDFIYEVHALTPGAADGIASGAMAKKVAWVFKDAADFEFLGEV